jgi:hypothetical protein
MMAPAHPTQPPDRKTRAATFPLAVSRYFRAATCGVDTDGNKYAYGNELAIGSHPTARPGEPGHRMADTRACNRILTENPSDLLRAC